MPAGAIGEGYCMPLSVQRVVECVHEAAKNQERLVIIAGRPGSGKSKIMRELSTMRGWRYLDCKAFVTHELMDLTPKARAEEAPHLIFKFIESLRAETVLLDGLQVLFAPVLHLAPLELLRQLSRKQTIVAAWPGEYQDGKLIFSYTGYETAQKQYAVENCQVIQIG